MEILTLGVIALLSKFFDPNRRPIYLPEISATESATECTGLMPTPVSNAEEELSYQQLCSTALPEDWD